MSLRHVRFIPLAALVLVLVLVLVLPMRADAQLGGLIKKAKEKILAPEQPSASASKLEAIGDPFDDTSLTATIAGLKVISARQAEIAALDKQADALWTSHGALIDKNKKIYDEYYANRDAISNCTDADMASRQKASEAAQSAKMAEKMYDKDFMMEVMNAQRAMQEATMKGDTVAQRTQMAKLSKLVGADMDSSATFKKCGRVPSKPAAMIEDERLQKQRDDILGRMRTLQGTSEVEAAKAAGTTPAKFLKQRERLLTFQSDKKPFSPQEQQLISGRMPEIAPLLK
jgi:hypothetical protein